MTPPPLRIPDRRVGHVKGPSSPFAYINFDIAVASGVHEGLHELPKLP